MKAVMRYVLISVIILTGLAFIASSDDYLSGSEISGMPDPYHTQEWYEKTGTSPSDYEESGIETEVAEAMRGEGIFIIDPRTGMTPGITGETPTGTTFANISGNWTIELSGNVTGTLKLVLYQVNGIVFGYGTMNVSGTELVVTACGAINDSALYLDIVTLGDVNLFGLNLTLGENTVTGSYVGYSSTGYAGFGAAVGTKD